MGRGQRLSDIGASAEAGVGEPPIAQLSQCLLVGERPLRLDEDRKVPAYAEPAQVFVNAVDEFRPGAGLVEVLDAQQEPALVAPAAAVRSAKARNGL